MSRLLLVDDEADIRAIAKMALERIGGWTVTAAGSADEAVAAATAECPDVVLLDVMMPDVDGPATLERLRPLLGQDVPVIFLTAKSQHRRRRAPEGARRRRRDRQAVRPAGPAGELAAIIGR